MSTNKKSSNNALAMTLLKGRTFIVLIVLLIFFSIKAANFLSLNTAMLIAKHVALYGILGIGMTYVIITGGIDLSVGAIVGLAGMIAGGLLEKGLTLYFNVPAVFIITMLLGVVIGTLNGLVITRFNVAPFIATLGMMYVARGFAMIRSGGATYSKITGNEALGNTGWEVFGRNIPGTVIPVGVVILAIIAVIAAVILRKTAFGWHVLSIGGNEKAARLSGINDDRVLFIVYLNMSVLAAIAGIVFTARMNSCSTMIGNGFEGDAIAACFIGGASPATGSGTILGALIGALVIGVLNNGMSIMGVQSDVQMCVKGLVLMIAVVFDQMQRKGR